MTLQNHTVLITGGSSGIGLELAKRLTKLNNQVLICGRSADKLEETQKQLPSVQYLQCDISNAGECEKLAEWVRRYHPKCNILVNNAAIAHPENFYEGEDMLDKAGAEIQTNLMAPIRLSKLLAPVLLANENPAIINITTGLVYAPRILYPFYNATKAGLHAFTQVLRAQSQGSGVRVTEVLMPVVDTPWHKTPPPDIAISPQQAVEGMLKGLKKGKSEVRVGKVKLLYLLFRLAPGLAFKKINSL